MRKISAICYEHSFAILIDRLAFVIEWQMSISETLDFPEYLLSGIVHETTERLKKEIIITSEEEKILQEVLLNSIFECCFKNV